MEREANGGQVLDHGNSGPSDSLRVPSPASPLQPPTLDGAQQHLLFLGGGTGIVGGQ